MWIAEKGRKIALASLVDPAATALVVIDVQNNFCHPEGAFGRTGHDTSTTPAMAARVRELLAAARDKGRFVVFVRATYDALVTSVPLAQHRRGLGLMARPPLSPGHCGAAGWAWTGDKATSSRPASRVCRPARRLRSLERGFRVMALRSGEGPYR